MAIPKMYTDVNSAREHLEKLLWADGVICPHCGSVDKSTKLEGKSTRPGVYKCKPCRKPFSVTVGTVFERSKIPLNQWVYATDLLTASKKGMSSHQLHRMLGVTYKTAWFMTQRIREAMIATGAAPMGGEGGEVQADETYYGSTSKRSKSYRKGLKRKAAVMALVDPVKGEVRAFHFDLGIGASDVRNVIVKTVSRKSTLVTDESPLVTDESRLYTKLGTEFSDHQTVVHAGREYVNKEGFTTNNVENFFGIFKKVMVGVYHFCGEQHLQRHLTEFSFRYTHRSGVGINDKERGELVEGYRRPAVNVSKD
jgi:transposase-like protein